MQKCIMSHIARKPIFPRLIPTSKDASINEEIENCVTATSALFERRDVLIVASVSSIYGLGSPQEYRDHVVSLRVGMEKVVTR